MQLNELCLKTQPTWTEKYADAFMVADGNGQPKTVFRYRIPFETPKDAIIQQKYTLSHQERLTYYQTLAQGIHRHVEICNLLKAQETPSILTCEIVEQETDAGSGSSCIYIQTEPVKPILSALFGNGISLVSLLDVFIRLSVIIRDLSKEGCGVSHRGITLDHIYINSENKILLGGFYYATAPSLPEILPYLPDHPRHLPPALLRGETGSAGTDIQTISRMLYNILAGLPWDTRWPIIPKTVPAYAPEGLTEILRFGMNCEDADCNAFRRQLLNFRKELNKTNLAEFIVPTPNHLRTKYVFR